MSQPVLLVTGCASGFGRMAAAHAADEGWKVYAGMRDLSGAPEFELPPHRIPVTPIQLDVTDRAQLQAAVERIRSEQGRLDGLVNNAGVALGGFLEEVDEDELRQVFEVNVFGAWAVTRACLPLLREAAGRVPRPTVVMVSSVSGVVAMPGLGAYAGSKFALEGLSESWRHELAAFGVRLCLLQPGTYRTDIWGRNRRLSRNAGQPGPYKALFERLLPVVEKHVEAEGADPAEVVHAILGLLRHPAPPFRTALGPGVATRVFIKRHLPFWVLERAIRRTFGN